jgi:hypothetical protein
MKLEGAQRGSNAFEKKKIPASTANHTTPIHSLKSHAKTVILSKALAD